MGGAIAGGGRVRRSPANGSGGARQAFERAVAEFAARPQLRCKLERLAAAALELHDAGVAALERRYERAPGSFGGRMATHDQGASAADKWLASTEGQRLSGR